MNELWPHQRRGIDDVLAAIGEGVRLILLTSPTGMGKSRMVCEIIETLCEQGWYAVLYTNRLLLIDQLKRVLDQHGIDYGVRAAGHEGDDAHHRVQISSLPTEASRVLKRQHWSIHGAGQRCIAIADEAHVNDGPKAQAIYALHHDAGHVRLGVTATPIGLGTSYDKLIIAGTVAEGRACGALVPAVHFGPDEPDMRAWKKLKADADPTQISENDIRKAMMAPGIFGRVWTWFEKLNPEHKPTILFAPGVEESIWFAEQFRQKGVRSAHIDGQDVWIDGELHPTSPDLRADVLLQHRRGLIRVLTNRFVLREGVDCPWIRHMIFATIFGSVQSLLQSGGRGGRADNYEDTVALFGPKTHFTIADHGGNWWRWGSLNADREWRLDLTNASIYGVRAERLRQKKTREPWVCPECQRVNNGYKCEQCGFQFRPDKHSRPVVSTDGSLKEMTGDIFRPRRIDTRPEAQAIWQKMYWRSRTGKGSRSFAAAAALYAYENQWAWPSRDWKFMPKEEHDFYRLVSSVPMEALHA